MKILIVTSYFHPEIGAAASRIGNMANGLSERGAEVDILTPLPNYPQGRIFDGYRGKINVEEKIDGHRVFRYWTYATVSKKAIARAVNMVAYAAIIWLFGLRRSLIKSYDCVIIQSPPLLVSYSAMKLFKAVYGKKTILNVSDLWPQSAVELGAMREGSMSYKVFAHCERYIYKKADAVFGQSQTILDHIRGFEPDKDMFLYRNLQPIS